MTNIIRNCVRLSAFLLLVPVCSTVRADTDETQFLYVADYGGGSLLRYSYSFDETTNTIVANSWAAAPSAGNTGATFIASALKEGIQGTANDIIVVAAGGASLTRYNLNGSAIGTVSLTLGGSAYSLGSVGGIEISSNGQYMFVADAGKSEVDEIQLATGKVIAQVALTDAHDVLISPDGNYLYACSYNSGAPEVILISTNASTTGVMTSDGTLITSATATSAGMASPTGMTISGGELYIDNAVSPGAADQDVFEWNLASDTSASFNQALSSGNAEFMFGNGLGPDGNLYIAALGGASGRAGGGTITDGVYEMNLPGTSPGATTEVIAGEPDNDTGKTGTAGLGGLYAPKYLEFGVDFITANDAGTPEPGAIAFLCSLGVATGYWRRRRKRRI